MLRLPGNAPQGRVSSASAHAGPARRAPSCDAPHRSRLLGVGSTGAHLPGLALPGQPARSRRATATRTRALSERSVCPLQAMSRSANSDRRHPRHQFPRGGSFRIRPGAPEIDRARYTATVPGSSVSCHVKNEAPAYWGSKRVPVSEYVCGESRNERWGGD